MKSQPGDRGALLVEVGLIMYDLFAGKQQILPHHRFELRGAARSRRPLLNPRAVCTETYYDARLTYAERLCLELLQDGEAANADAHALNYVRMESAAGDTVTLKDEVTGEAISVQPKIVVNIASGASIDFANRAMQRPTQFIGGTKGSHLVVHHRELWEATPGQIMHFVNSDGRLTIFYPIEDKVFIGTTDIPVTDPDQATCDEEETDYLLQTVRLVFPGIKLDRSHVVAFGCAGCARCRAATLSSRADQPRSQRAARASKRWHRLPDLLAGRRQVDDLPRLLRAGESLLPAFGRTRTVDTKNLTIGGGANYPQSADARAAWIAKHQQKSGLPAERIDALLERYGTRAEAMIAWMQAGADRPLEHLDGYSQREIQFMAAQEKMAHLDDLILRRTLVGFLGRVNRAVLDELAAAAAPALGWSEADARREVERTAARLQRRGGVTLAEGW